ncbi:MAG: alpha/beta hydrolase [Tepidisphaeraceae bacterium]
MRFQAAIISVICLTSALAIGQSEPQVVHLWDRGAPGFESRRDEPEVAKDYWVRNIHNPSIAVFLPPKEKANGAAVLIIPGGGHRELVFNAEGRDPALFLNNLGATAFVLKYRLAREANSPYKIEIHARQDAYRAMRLIRFRAKDWTIDPNRLGILAFSAGGEILDLIAYAPGNGEASAPDPIDRLNGRPDFQMLIYPGPLGIPDVVPPDAPPAFMLVASDDTAQADVVLSLLQKYRKAGRPVEAHFFARGGHAFNMGDRSKLASIRSWPQRMADWLADSNILKSPEEETRNQKPG